MQISQEDNSPSSSDSENEELSSKDPQTEEQSRRGIQNARFKTLLSEVSVSVTKDNIKLALEDAHHPAGSTSRILAEQDFTAAITDPREYQIELFEKAKERNTIAVLDTGSGKTLIAILLLKHIIQSELIDRGQGKQPRISFFLVDSVTLVYQQAAVLRNNIDQKVTHLFGAMGLDLWSKEIWLEYFRESMVIVCTADILHQCLLNSHIRIENINLLIFDEAHHTKKEHAYARIIKDAYLKTDPAHRPRVFGMTASPLDAKGDVVKAAQNLEMLLDSRISTTSNLTLLRQVVSRPREQVWKYRRLDPAFKTALYESLESQFGDMDCLSKTFTFSFIASSELGEWCSNRVWTYALAEAMLPKLHGKITSAFKRLALEDANTKIEVDTKRLEQAHDVVVNYMSRDSDILSQVSPKVLLLHEMLSKHFEDQPDTKCIVFTKRRHTARLLGHLFTVLKVPNLRTGVLIGVKSGDDAGMNTTYHQQFKVMMSLRKGELNCLFATSVAEEGLDIPDCNLVIRFDLYDTLIQYIQSRGRARHPNSMYAHMIELDNLEHETRLEEVHEAETLMRRFCEGLPEDRLLGGNQGDVNDLLERDSNRRTYTISSTGATLTYRSALSVLTRYASSLQYENETYPQANYVVLSTQNMYVCEVILPEKSPVRGLIGKPASQKSFAKQSAAFDTCLLLRKHGLLDEFFMSTYHKRLPVMRNAKLAILSKKTNQYPRITKPAFWTSSCGATPEYLFVTVVILNPVKKLTRNHRNLVLLTRQRLLRFPEFPVFLEEDIETTVSSIPLRKELIVQERSLDMMTTFTLRIFRDLFNKTYEEDTEMMPYWLLPAAKDIDIVHDEIEPNDAIDWESLTYVKSNDEVPRTDSYEAGALEQSFVYDRWDGRYRYFITGISSLRASDPPPPGVERRRHMDSVMGYCLSLYKNSRATFLSRCDWNQPVFTAELVSLRRNLLDKMSDKEKAVRRSSVICLECVTISAIPASVAASCFSFPAIMTRFEAYLIASEACESLQLNIDPAYALEALTKDSDNIEEHRNEQIQFQRGMGKNYERLEFLGDCFLKMATSISLFAQNPYDQEYDYHVNRMCLICNKNLFRTAKDRKIYEFIRSKGFSRRSWYPQGIRLLHGKSSDTKDTSEASHALGEKTIADVCEALIGASLLTGGAEHRFDMAVRAVTVLVNSSSHEAHNWNEYYQLYSLPSYQIQAPDGFEKDLAQQVERRLGYHFKYPRLLRSAFTHPSYPSAWAKVPCYQRLEFLGDSLLDMACIEDIFARYPDRDPQWLTEHKMAMVSNKFLGTLAVQLGLHTHLQYFSNPLQSQITQYAEEIQMAHRESNGAMEFWLTTKDPPKCLPDMVEAYLGAIFVDSCFCFETVEHFYRAHIRPFFENMSLYDTFANKHPTTFLHNRLSKDFGCSKYCLKAGEIPAVDEGPTIVLAAVLVHDTILAKETASSGRYAKIKASQVGLRKLEELDISQFREAYHCDCLKGDEDAAPVEDVMGSAV